MNEISEYVAKWRMHRQREPIRDLIETYKTYSSRY